MDLFMFLSSRHLHCKVTIQKATTPMWVVYSCFRILAANSGSKRLEPHDSCFKGLECLRNKSRHDSWTLVFPSDPRQNARKFTKLRSNDVKTNALTKCRELLNTCCQAEQSHVHIMCRKYPQSAERLTRRREALWAWCRCRASVTLE